MEIATAAQRYVRKLGQSDPELVHRSAVHPGEEVQVGFGASPMIVDEQGE